MNDDSSKQKQGYCCPQCQASFQDKQEFFPFCTKRCQLIDLGAWAAEKYTIPVADSPGQFNSDDSETGSD